MPATLPALAPQTFTFTSNQLRVVLSAGEPWFVAADIIAALELDRKALERLDDDEKGVSSIHTPGGEQQMTVINESGLYSLILGSRKPEAKRFKKWVTSEVLPAIRKTGRYETAPTGPDAPYHRISPEQAQALGQAMNKLTANWLFGQSGNLHVHNHLRNAFNVRALADLPAADFERECLAGGTPWTPSIVKRLTRERGERVPLPPRVDWAKLSQEGKP